MTTPSLPPRYDLIALLGEGGMGQVYRVRDRELGAEVALKRLRLEPGVDEAQARFLFKQEFWSMASLKHPHLVEALDFGEGPDGVPYMTMALVPGADLAIDEGGQAEDAVRGWLPQIASALAFLHGRGFVHGDLKPENVRLTPDGHAVLMDLGLLAPSGRAGEPIRGSIAYMAPEVIRQGAVDARSDMYALGALLYHALTGRAPFQHANVMVVLRAHLDQRPEKLSERAPGVSPEMEAVVMRLLAKAPEKRFSSIDQLMSALGLAAVGDEHAGLLASPIVGREAAQAALKTALLAEEGARVWLTGPSGAGKTRLLGEARAEVQLAGRSAIALRGLGADAAPYEALQPLLRSLAETAEGTEPTLAAVLARVVPDLGITPAPPLEGVAERLRLQSAVVTLARTVYPRASWLIDGADQLDAASSALVAALQKEASAHWNWCMSGAEAPEGAEAITLAPLPDEAVLDIARQRLGQDDLPAGLAERLVPLAGGQPGAIEALLSHWIHTGALARAAGAWAATSTLELPGGLKLALDAGLASLGDEARQLAGAAAVMGASGDLAALRAVMATFTDDAFFAALRELMAAEVLVSDDRGYHFARPSQALQLVAALEDAERRALHDAAAEAGVARTGHAPEDAPLAEALTIAQHALSGSAPARAVPWVVAAASRAIAHFTLDPADALLRRALAVEGLDEAARLSLERLQANVWRHQGKGKEALERYTEGRLLERFEAAGDPSLAEETTSYGALLSVVGRYDEAREALARAIALTDDGADPATAVRARIYAGRAAYFSGDAAAAKATLKEAVAIGRAAREAGKPAMLAVALSFYGYFLASGGAVEEGLEALAEAVEAAGTADHPVQANEAQSMRGNVLMAGGRPREAKEAFEAILATCARFDLPYDELMARLNLSAAWLALGNAFEARAHAERVAETSRAGGRRFPEAFARAVAGRARIQLGELAVGEHELKAGLAIAQEIGNRYLELNVLVPYVDALNALGRPEAAIEAIAKARDLAASLNSHEHDATLDRYEAEAALQQALAPDAGILALTLVGERLSGYASRMRASGRKSDLAHALQLQASWSQRCGDMAPGRAWVDEALVIAEAAGLERLVARLDFTRAKLAATAALQASAVAGLQSVSVAGFARAGDRAKALGDVMLDLISTAGALQVQNLNRETQAIAKQLEALTEGLDRAEADRYLHQPDLVEITRSLPAAGMSPAARDVLGLVASFDDSGDLPALLKRAVSTMVGFAGAERGFLLLFEDMDTTHKVVHGIYDDDDMTFSASLAYQVLWSEESLFVEDAQADGQFAGQASVRALDLRSVVGVPLLVNGGAIGVMIADSQEVTASFSDFHLELLEALARRVSGAIGNARLRQEEARRAATSDMLERLALATVGCVDLEEFMAPVAAEALALTGADRLCLLVGEALTCRVAFDRDGKSLPVDEQAPSLSASRWVYEHDEPLHLHDALTSETFSAQRSVMALGLRTIHAVPVTHAQRVLGVLYLDDRRVGVEDPHVTAALRKLGAMVGALLTRRGLID